jgi:hypothetical protein
LKVLLAGKCATFKSSQLASGMIPRPVEIRGLNKSIYVAAEQRLCEYAPGS